MIGIDEQTKEEVFRLVLISLLFFIPTCTALVLCLQGGNCIRRDEATGNLVIQFPQFVNRSLGNPQRLLTQRQVHDLIPDIRYDAECKEIAEYDDRASTHPGGKSENDPSSNTNPRITETSTLYTCCSTCSICLEDFVPGERLKQIPACGHLFHLECILPWLTERSPTCPNCKADALDRYHEEDHNHQRRNNEEERLMEILDELQVPLLVTSGGVSSNTRQDDIEQNQ